MSIPDVLKTNPEFAGQMYEALRTAISDLLGGASGDVKAYAGEIASNMVMALSTGRDDLVEEMKHQLLVLGAIHQIRLEKAAQEFLENAIGALMKLVPALIFGV